MDFDLVIKNGTVIDGTGRRRFHADLGLRGGKVAVVSASEPLSCTRTLDASRLAVAPGFIDFHSHSEWVAPLPDHDRVLAPLVLQGITTMVAGQCGFSPAPVTDETIPLVDHTSAMLRESAFPYRWRSVREFLDVLQSDGMMINTALLAGHAPVRYAVVGDSLEPPQPEQLEAMCRVLRKAIRDGAFGMSAGLGYTPGMFAQTEELLALLRVVAEEGAVYTVHNRTYRWATTFYEPMVGGVPHNIRAIREQLDLARRSSVRLQLSHLIFVGRNTWPTYQTALQEIDALADEGYDLAFDAFPYTYGNTTINVNLPKWYMADLKRNLDDPAELRRVEQEWDEQNALVGRDYSDIYLLWAGLPELADLDGLHFAAVAEQLNMRPAEAYVHVAKLSDGRARILQDTFSGDGSSEEPLQAVLSHPRCSFMLDTILTRGGKANPASYGTFPRLLGRYSRDLGLFTLEETVRRSTSYSAERLGLGDQIGRVAPGYWADLVLFDPDTVGDNTTLEQPDTPPSGIHTVLISGQVVAQGGQITTRARHGRVLRR
jgi:N-acyl-D-amino-acid deacylase